MGLHDTERKLSCRLREDIEGATSGPGSRREVMLLLRCARIRMAPADAVWLRALLLAPLDWASLLRLASRHRLLPLLYRHLSRTCERRGQTPAEGGLSPSWPNSVAIFSRPRTEIFS